MERVKGRRKKRSRVVWGGIGGRRFKVQQASQLAKARDFIILTRANIIAEADKASHPTHSTVYVKHLKEDIFEHH